MKNEKENKHAEEWVAPSIDVIDINKDTMNGDIVGGEDYGIYS